jgi:hypothetical protein
MRKLVGDESIDKRPVAAELLSGEDAATATTSFAVPLSNPHLCCVTSDDTDLSPDAA